MEIDFILSENANMLHIMDVISGVYELTIGRDWQAIKDMYMDLFPESKLDSGPLTTSPDSLLTDKGHLTLYNAGRMAMYHGNLSWLQTYLSTENLEEAIRKAFPKHLVQNFMHPLMHFKDNIRELFALNEEKLVKRKNSIIASLEDHSLDQIVSDIQSFYASSFQPDKFKVYLLLNAPCKAHYAIIYPDSRILLMPIYLGRNEKRYALLDIAVIGHEIIHLVEEHTIEKNTKKYSEIVRDKHLTSPEIDILREGIAESLLVYGVLGKKYDLVKRKLPKGIIIPPTSDPKYVNQFRKKLGAYLYESSFKVIEGGRSMFEGNYLKNAMDILISLRP